MTREKAAWCSQRGVAHITTTETLLARPGTTLMRPACNARIPARTTETGCIINSFNAGVIFWCAAVANPVSDTAGQRVVTVTPSRLSSRCRASPSATRRLWRLNRRRSSAHPGRPADWRPAGSFHVLATASLVLAGELLAETTRGARDENP